jgi:methionyl-tRNA synthetase
VANLAKKHSLSSGVSPKGQIQKEISNTQEKYKKALADFKFNEALISAWDLISFCDKYIEKEKPWEDKENSKEVIANLLSIVDETLKLLEPFLPQSSKEAAEQLKSEKAKALFPRI